MVILDVAKKTGVLIWALVDLLNLSFEIFFTFNLPIYLQSVYIHSNTIRCVGKRGLVEECSVAPLRDKRVKTLCGCRGKKGTN
jgi:hypothetical protein